MHIARERAEAYDVVRPAFTPHGVYWAEPLRPDSWTLQPADARATDPYGSAYHATIVYANGNGDNNEDVEQEVNLDAVACLIPQNNAQAESDAPISAPLLAYLALKHAGDGDDLETLSSPCATFARIGLRTRRINYVYNFLDHGAFAGLASDDFRLDLYGRILFSYILWSVIRAQEQEDRSGSSQFKRRAEAVRQQAGQGHLPVRNGLHSPLEQAVLLGLHIPGNERNPEGQWPYLEALPVVPMRGIHGSVERVYGHGGTHFLGKHMIV